MKTGPLSDRELNHTLIQLNRGVTDPRVVRNCIRALKQLATAKTKPKKKKAAVAEI